MVTGKVGNKTAVLHPRGHPVTAEDLPPVDLGRWSAMRKAEVVACVHAGLISIEQACKRYLLSEDEFLSWERDLNDHGVAGLQSNQLQKYRVQSHRED